MTSDHRARDRDDAWRRDELLSQPPKTYLGPGGSFCCALTLRLIVLIVAVVVLVLCIVTQVTVMFEEAEPHKWRKTTYLLWWTSEEDTDTGDTERDDREDDLSGTATCLVIGLVLSIIALAMAITYVALLCVHRSQRRRDDEAATRRYRARFEKLEESEMTARSAAAESAGAQPQSQAERRAVLMESLRREAHDDSMGLYWRERKRRNEDLGIWITLLLVILATFALVIAGFIKAVLVFNDEYKIDKEDQYPGGDSSSLREGVWIALVAAILALVAFILTALYPCIRGRREPLTQPAPYRTLNTLDDRTPSTRRGEFELYPDADPKHSGEVTVPTKAQGIATGVPLQPNAAATGDGEVPVAENYATYHPEYGRGFYYNNEGGQTMNNRVQGASPREATKQVEL